MFWAMVVLLVTVASGVLLVEWVLSTDVLLVLWEVPLYVDPSFVPVVVVDRVDEDEWCVSLSPETAVVVSLICEVEFSQDLK